jgi:hypothetical protein
MDTDRNLLFAVLALQAHLIDQPQFADVCAAWAAHRDTPLPDLLVERGWITAADRDYFKGLLERQVKRHGGDTHTSLLETAGAEARRALAALNDPAFASSLAKLPTPGPALPTRLGRT